MESHAGPALPPNTPRASAHRLLQRFTALSIVSVVAILILVGVGLHYIYRAQVMERARDNSVAVAEAIAARERESLVQRLPDGRLRIGVSEADRPKLDARMREFLNAFGMFKVKLYDAGGKIVYSSDPSIVGMVDAGNARLDQVLRLGEADAQLVMKDKIADLQGRERFQADVVETYVPLRERGEVIGALEVYVDVTPAREAHVTALQLSLTVLLVVLAGVFGALYIPMRQGTIRLAEVQDQLREMASTDMLTGLANRRQLVSRIGEEYARLERARRSGEPLEAPSFIMADIDHFKRINDTHGHAAGDEALRQVAASLKGLLRPYDVIGRFGGEEFLVMLPGTGPAEAGVVAERMRQKVAESPLDIGGGALRLTVSFGVACARDDQDDAEAAIRRADEALYAAKNAGRNRVATVS